MFNGQTALEQFEAFLDTPATMVEIGELAGREGIRIEQRGGQKFAQPGRQADTDQADREATLPNLKALGSRFAGGGSRNLNANDCLWRG